jgi:LuxR family maltose regulon positive regulatory protein
LNRVTTLELTAPQLDALSRLTEGWPAAVYLAGLSLRNAERVDVFIDSFEGGHRVVYDYLGSEVLQQIPESTREFLTQTSILRRLCASLCDTVASRTDSASLIAELEKDNSFLVPLDDRRDWYRYHHLFAALLRLDLQSRAPESVRELHHRAARWFDQAGDVDAAIHHFLEAHDYEGASHSVIAHWQAYERSGQIITVGRWLAGFPEQVITAEPRLAVIAALIGAKLGAPRPQVEHWLTAAEAAGSDAPEVPGSFAVPYAIAATRAINSFGDVRGSLAAARTALAEAGNSYEGVCGVIAAVALGRCLYLAGAREVSHRVLTDSLRHLPLAE